MPKYLIRRNMNGRPLGTVCQTLESDQEAMAVAAQWQAGVNREFEEGRATGKKMRAVPVIEVLRLIWEGEPTRADPERIRKRREKVTKALEAERRGIKEWLRLDTLAREIEPIDHAFMGIRGQDCSLCGRSELIHRLPGQFKTP